MSFFRQSPSLPRRTSMLLSPRFFVGSALILGLAVAFWAVKSTQQQRSDMLHTMEERAGTLMWAAEGGARAGMGMRSTAAYLQFMLEEIARQPDIAYMAVVTAEGDIRAHSDPLLVGTMLHAENDLPELAASAEPQWRELKDKEGKHIFEAYRTFAPLPGFREQLRHNGMHGHGRQRGMGMMRSKRMREAESLFPAMPPEAAAPPGFNSPVDPPFPPPSGPVPSPPPSGPGELIIVIGLDMAPLEGMLAAGVRSTLFTALLVGLLGVGGFVSLYWAQNYKFSQRLLLDTTALADEVIKSLPLGLMVTDAQGAVTQVNGAGEALLGCRGKELAGRRVADMPDSVWRGLAARAQAGEAVLEEEYELMLPAFTACSGGTASAVPVSVSASCIINEEGENLGVIYLLRDLREMKRLQAELRRSERLSTLGNMAARVAHEIRNPLSSIKGFATYLGSRQNAPQDAEAARTMIGEVDRLNRVVSELLDFARPSDLRIKNEQLVGVLERALRLVGPDAEAKGVCVALEPSHLPAPQVAVDAERITQALLNLLLNAVQAVPSGGAVRVAVQPPAGDGYATVTLSDNGRGMTPEVLAQVFSPYFTTRAQGTGLGLSIVSKIIEDHQGEIRMESTAGEGTTVTLRLPSARADRNGVPESSAADAGEVCRG